MVRMNGCVPYMKFSRLNSVLFLGSYLFNIPPCPPSKGGIKESPSLKVEDAPWRRDLGGCHLIQNKDIELILTLQQKQTIILKFMIWVQNFQVYAF